MQSDRFAQWDLKSETLGFLPIVNSYNAILILELILEPDTNHAYTLCGIIILKQNKIKKPNQTNQTNFQKTFFLEDINVV